MSYSAKGGSSRFGRLKMQPIYKRRLALFAELDGVEMKTPGAISLPGAMRKFEFPK
jgi:hypothetical protein